MNFELVGTSDHKVQTNVIFKLVVTKDGQPFDCTMPVKGWLKGLRDTVDAKVTKPTVGEVQLCFFPGSVGHYELQINVGAHSLYKGGDYIVKIVDQFLKVPTELRFEITGDVLQGGIVGEDADINIGVKDPLGTLSDVNLQELEFRVGTGSNLVKSRPERISTGKYKAKLKATLPGMLTFDLHYEEKSVLSKAQQVKFVLGSDPKQTKAVQVPTRMVTVGEKTSFTIQTRNRNSLNNTTGGETFEIGCNGPEVLTDLVVRDTLDGKYIVSFTPTASGIYEFDICLVTLNGKEPIGNSPVKMSATRR